MRSSPAPEIALIGSSRSSKRRRKSEISSSPPAGATASGGLRRDYAGGGGGGEGEDVWLGGHRVPHTRGCAAGTRRPWPHVRRASVASPAAKSGMDGIPEPA